MRPLLPSQAVGACVPLVVISEAPNPSPDRQRGDRGPGLSTGRLRHRARCGHGGAARRQRLHQRGARAPATLPGGARSAGQAPAAAARRCGLEVHSSRRC